MSDWAMDITNADIDAALEAAKSLPDRPIATSAVYDATFDLVVLRLSTGRRFAIPREELQGLHDATEVQLSEIEIHCGVDIAWPQLDVDHYLPSLLERRYGSKLWMESLERRSVAA